MPETFGKRLRRLRTAAGLTLENVGRACGVTAQSVHGWEIDRAFPSGERINALALALNVTVSLLLTGRDQLSNNERAGGAVEGEGRSVPVLTPEQAISFAPNIVHAQRILTRYTCSEKSFSVGIWDRANEPMYAAGDTVVIDPALAPRPGDMVLCAVGRPAMPLFGRYAERSIDGRRAVEIIPSNPDWAPYRIASADDGAIIGVMTEHTRPRRA